MIVAVLNSNKDLKITNFAAMQEIHVCIITPYCLSLGHFEVGGVPETLWDFIKKIFLDPNPTKQYLGSNKDFGVNFHEFLLRKPCVQHYTILLSFILFPSW
jgi:hypothetical protein